MRTHSGDSVAAAIDPMRSWDLAERHSAIRRAVEHFVSEVEQGRTELVASLLAGNLQQLLGIERLERIFSDGHDEIRARGGVARIEYVNLADDIDEARVDIRMVYGDGSFDTERVVLVQGAERWQIDMRR